MAEPSRVVCTSMFKNRANVIWKIKEFSVRPLSTSPPRLEVSLNGTCVVELSTSNKCIYLKILNSESIRAAQMVYKVALRDVHGVRHHQKHGEFGARSGVHTFYMEESELMQKKSILLPNDCLTMCVELMQVDPWQEDSLVDKEVVSFSRTEDLSRDLGLLYTNKINSDVVLQLQNYRIPVHSQILSARSEVFAAMFKHDTVESRSRTVQIPDVDAAAMNYLLLYMYTGKLEQLKGLPQETVGKIYAAADKYAVLGLKEMCSNFLRVGLTSKNFPDYANLAFNHNDARLQNAVVNFIANDAAVLKSQQWLQMAADKPVLASQVLGELLKSKTK